MIQRVDDINRNMAAREHLLRESGFSGGVRKQANQSALIQQRHKQPASMLTHYDDVSTALNSNGDRSAVTSYAGSRQKAARLIIKKQMGKDELKSEVLPPPPMGKSIGHGLLDSPPL